MLVSEIGPKGNLLLAKTNKERLEFNILRDKIMYCCNLVADGIQIEARTVSPPFILLGFLG
jgi:hypothetical protein